MHIGTGVSIGRIPYPTVQGSESHLQISIITVEGREREGGREREREKERGRAREMKENKAYYSKINRDT